MPPQSHILVVDDEPEILESLIDYLNKKTNYAISEAGNGQEAVRFLQHSVDDGAEVDLVLLDMRMPLMSGLEVLAWIRHHPALQFMRVVLLTAAAGSNEKVEALAAGADDYITKPYYPQELLARVQTILRTQQLEKQLQRQGQQLSILNGVGQLLAAQLETGTVLETAVSKFSSIIPIRMAAISLLEKGQLRRRAACADGQLLAELPPQQADSGITGVVFAEKTAVYLNTPTDDPRFNENDHLSPYTVDNLIMAPLVVRGKAIGVISGYNKQGKPFTPFNLELLSSFASSISDALANAWLFQKGRQRQQELLESRNILQALTDGIPHPIYTINDTWELLSVNEAKLEMYDQLLDKQEARPCYAVFYDRERPCDHCRAAETLAKQQGQTWVVKWKGDDHLPREWEVAAYPIPSVQQPSAVVFWQDRTEKRRLENSLLQAGKLAAIGQLAAGVAHEINNPLTAVNANAELLKLIIPKTDDNYESVDLIARGGQRATKVVRGLLDFARQEEYHLNYGDVNNSITRTLDLVQYQLNSAQVELDLQLSDSLPPIAASWEHLKGVWLNLFINARDALRDAPEPRRLTIITRVDPDDTDGVQILIQDSGSGISTAELPHIFDPFYTTKSPGQGTGLGLATSHRIIEQHGGIINAISTAEDGTTFIIHLPINNN